MRLIETLCCLVVLASFAGSVASSLPSLCTLSAQTRTRQRQCERDRFIVFGFRAACASGERERLDEWQSACRSLWKLDAFSVKKFGFTAEGKPVLVCVWKAERTERHVFAIYNETEHKEEL